MKTEMIDGDCVSGEAMEAGFFLKLPAYTLLLKDGTGALLLRHGEDLWLPLFTDEDAVQTYVERAGLVGWCLIQRFNKAGELGDFLRNPPSRSGSCDIAKVVIDPIDPQPRGVTLLAVENILASIPPRTPKEIVLEKYPHADSERIEPVFQSGQSTPIDLGGWVIHSAPGLGTAVLGRGPNEELAWKDAASRIQNQE